MAQVGTRVTALMDQLDGWDRPTDGWRPGPVNQRIAAASDDVLLVIAGRVLQL